MCIRDRALTLLWPAAAYQVFDGLYFGSSFTLRGAGDTRVPVSYTHLRAHETVLDIVCRLLLEKKKDTKFNSQLHYVTMIT